MRGIVAAVALGFLTAGAASAAPVTFSDATFADASWVATKVVDTSVGATATFAAGQQPAAGNPGAYRQTTHTFDPGQIAVAHWFQGGVYDPAVSGAIAGVDFAFDAIHLNPPPNQAVAYSILLLQGGSYYRSGSNNVFDAAWTPFSGTGLTAISFLLVSGPGPANPNFGAGGLPIRVGYLTANSNTGGASGLVRTSGIDNWSVTIHPVPEPALAALLALALLRIWARRAA